MNWTQAYNPLGHWWLSSLVAALPIFTLLGLLAGLKVPPHICAMAGAAMAVLVAVFVFGMPAPLAMISFAYGALFGALKIVWIVVAAVYLYNISVEAGQFDIMKRSIAGITADRRLQVLIVAFCFGAFLEGAAGFGTPVAIAGAFMIGMGFDPFHAATLNLIANTAPVAWGSIGVPLHTLAAVTALPESDLSAMVGRILPFTATIVPFWLVRTMVGWEETLEVLPAILVIGFSFAGAQFFWSNYMDSNLVDIVAGLVSTACILLFLRIWQPKNIYRFAGDKNLSVPVPGKEIDPVDTPGQIAKAWMPFAILSLFVLLWGIPSIKLGLGRATTPSFQAGGWQVPLLHKTIFRTQPVVAKPTAEAALFDFNWLTATGSGCFLAALLAGTILGIGPAQLMRIFAQTVWRMRLAIIAMGCMLGLGYVTRYSGMDAVLGLAFTRTGWLFPFFGTFIGWLGVALTGSDTSSNALFGGLQRFTAQQLGLNPILMCATNSAGGVMGKMIDAQSITVATAATNQVGNEGNIFRYVFWHSVALAAIVGVIVMIYAYVVPQLIPHGLTFIR